MPGAPFDSAEADKLDAAFTRKGRTGLGFTSQPLNNNPTATPYQTQAQRELLSSSSTSAFSASAYLHKFGWRTGTGLGKREDGVVSYVKVSKKEDQAGIGAGLTVTAIARSFETVYNNAARNFNVVIHPDSDDEDANEGRQQGEDGAQEERKEERIVEQEGEQDKEVGGRRKDKKRKQREEDKEERKQLSSDDCSSSSASPTPPSATAVRTRIAFKSATSSHSTTAILSTLAVAPDSLLAFDPSRSHMYHDRCRGKLARLMAQESMGQHIVEAVKRKRWEGLEARDDMEEAVVVDVAEALDEDDNKEGMKMKRRAEKKERRRHEREAAQQTKQAREDVPMENEAIELEAAVEKKRRKQEKKEAKRRRLETQ